MLVMCRMIHSAFHVGSAYLQFAMHTATESSLAYFSNKFFCCGSSSPKGAVVPP